VQLSSEDPSASFLLARCLFDPENPEPTLRALVKARCHWSRYPEAEIFHRLLAEHCCGADSPQLHESRSLSELADAHPQARHRVDAAQYIREAMPEARLFCSTRDTLRFATNEATSSGNVVELGVFHGVSLRWLAQWRPGDVHGFDSFEGLPDAWERVPRGRFTTAGQAPTGIEAQLWVGRFEERLPEFVEQHPEPLALLHVDSDLYESARCGLELLGPQLRPGSIIVFDEYLGHRSWRQDEFRAFQEAVAANGWSYAYLAANPFTGQVVVQIRGLVA
jgi:hypothetical protein